MWPVYSASFKDIPQLKIPAWYGPNKLYQRTKEQVNSNRVHSYLDVLYILHEIDYVYTIMVVKQKKKKVLYSQE